MGKTLSDDSLANIVWKHPHGRGEDNPFLISFCAFKETPPRAWGRPIISLHIFLLYRNTPTGVGKTSCTTTCTITCRKHPHGRGEDIIEALWCVPTKETPPRAWGRLNKGYLLRSLFRNTPTGVGKTITRVFLVFFGRKHPHGRGEDTT